MATYAMHSAMVLRKKLQKNDDLLNHCISTCAHDFVYYVGAQYHIVSGICEEKIFRDFFSIFSHCALSNSHSSI